MYFIFFLLLILDFTNICRPDKIQELATADESCSVKEVHEFFGDYIPIDADHYTLNLSRETKDDAAILITLKKDEYVFNYENEFLKKIIYIGIGNRGASGQDV